MKRSMFLLAVMSVSFSIGCCHKRVRAGITFDPDTLEVRIRQNPGARDCSVDYEAVNVRRRTHDSAADRIRWCVKRDPDVQYYIHFTSNDGLNSPFGDNDFLVNQNRDDDRRLVCSDLRMPQDDKPLRAYEYEIHMTSVSGATCSDPKVILK